MSDDYKELLQKYNSLLEENKRLKDELALLKGEARLSVPELKIPSEFSNINHYMKKDIKTKLEKLSKENLIDIISKLCEIPDVEKSLKLLVCPNKKDIERELSLFERWCNSVANNPCSEIAENG